MENFRDAIANGGAAPEGGGAEGGIPEGGAPQGNEPQGNESPSFLDQIPEEFRTEPSLTDIKDIGGLVKGFINAQKMIGGSIKVPGQDATEDQWNDFYNKAGRPEAADKYDFQSHEDLGRADEEIAEMRALFHKAGLNQNQARALAEGHDAGLMRKLEAQKLAAQQMNEEFLKTAHHEFGGPEGWSAKQAQVQEFLVNKVPENIRAEMTGLDNRALLSIVYSINEALSAAAEDRPIGQPNVNDQLASENPSSLKQKAQNALVEARKMAPRSNEAKEKYKEFQRYNAAYHQAMEKRG